MSLGYKVYRRTIGSKTRELVAKFAKGDEAYGYGMRHSADPYATISVVGWDDRVWWQFRSNQQLPLPRKPGSLATTTGN